MNDCLNFEILKELNRGNKPGVEKAIRHYDTRNCASTFNPTSQNIQVISFMNSLNPKRYLEELENSYSSIEDLMSEYDPAKSAEKQTNRFYVIYNYLYFAKLSKQQIGYFDTFHFSFRSLLHSSTALPNFAILKLFLSKMNYLFNTQNQLRYFEHVQEIQRLSEYAKEFRPVNSSPDKFNNSCLYGAKFYSLTDLNQNNFSAIEIDIVCLALWLISHLFLKNYQEAKSRLSDVRSKLELLKTSGSQSDSLTSTNYEDSLKKKLCKHVSAIIEFLGLIIQVKEGQAINTSDLLSNKALFNETGVSTKYKYPVLNLMGVINFRENRHNLANAQFIQTNRELQEEMKIRDSKPNKFHGLSKLNNQSNEIPVLFNLFLTSYSTGNYERAIELSETIVTPFRNCHKFWYYLGLSYYRLWSKEMQQIVKAETDEERKKVGRIQMNLATINCWLLTRPLSAQDQIIRKLNLKSSKGLEESALVQHITKTIKCFENSLKILQNLNSREYLSTVLQPPNSKSKEYYNGIKNKITEGVQPMLNSVVEHLSYLYIFTNQPAHALKTISIATSQSEPLKAETKNKLMIYNLKAVTMLKKQSEVKLINSQLEESITRSEPSQLPLRSLDGNRVTKIPLALLVKYNKLVGGCKDKETAKKTMQSLLDEFFKLSESCRKEINVLIKNALFWYFTKVEFSYETIRIISDTSFDTSTFSLSKHCTA